VPSSLPFLRLSFPARDVKLAGKDALDKARGFFAAVKPERRRAVTCQKWEGYMDIYTKVVLTIIAVAPSIIALKGAGMPALAQSGGVTRVVICGAEANPRGSGQLSCARVLTDINGVGRLVITQ